MNQSEVEHMEKSLAKLSGLCTVGIESDDFAEVLQARMPKPRTRSAEESLEFTLALLLKQFLTNNHSTGNLAMLVRRLVYESRTFMAAQASDLAEPAAGISNMILLLRVIVKYLSERMPAEALQRHVSVIRVVSTPDQFIHDSPELNENLDQHLIVVLLSFIGRTPLSSATVEVHEESVSLLLALLGSRMFDDRAAEENVFFRHVMTSISYHNEVLKRLLENFISQNVEDEAADSPIINSLASRAWDAITSTLTDTYSPSSFVCPSSLANKSLLLLEVLCNHCSRSNSEISNPYKEVLGNVTDFSLNVASYHDSGNVNKPGFSVNFELLYYRICQNLRNDHVTLVLYMLLHRNNAFKNYVFCRNDLDLLVIPLLEVLYRPKDTSSHQLYMVLIILLILSEDNIFNRVLSEIRLPQATWFNEKLLTDVDVMSLEVLVLLRTIQYNITQMKDKYLHTNCLATLANMSSHFSDLHQYCSQRFTSLLTLLQKKQQKIMKKLAQSDPTEDDAVDELHTELSVIDEIMRMLLEIINSALTNQLSSNAPLIHALLYEKSLFDPLRGNHNFQDVVHNIEMVVNFFLGKLEKEDGGHIGSSEMVVKCIRENCKGFPLMHLQKFPELKFKYCEEEEPEDFFIPYVWSMVYRHSGLYWNLDLISLFRITNEQ